MQNNPNKFCLLVNNVINHSEVAYSIDAQYAIIMIYVNNVKQRVNMTIHL